MMTHSTMAAPGHATRHLIETDPDDAAPDHLARRAAELGRLVAFDTLPYGRELRLIKRELERQLEAAGRV